jgi:signal transduction histidine kinase
LNPQKQAQELWLTFSNPLLDRITVHLHDADGQLRTFKTGEHWRGEAGSEPVIVPSVRLTLAPGETRVLIRLEADASMATRVALLDRASLQRMLDLHALKAAVVVACQLVAAIAALIVAVLMRSRLWRSFAIFTVGNGVVFAHLFGYLSWWFDAGGSYWPDRLGALAFTVALVAGVEFTARAIGLHATRPVLFTRSMMGLIAFAMCALLPVSLGRTALSIEALLGLALIASVVMLYALTTRALHRRKVGPFLTAGLVLYLGFLMARVLRHLGYLPSVWWTEALHEFASIVYLALIFTGMGLQSRAVLAERDRLAGQLDAERKNRLAERDFLAMLSHELRTPLATIEATASVLRELDHLDSSARRSRFEKIERAVNRIRQLFDRHLIGARLRDDWYLPRFARTDLVKLLTELVEERYRDRRDAHLRLDFASPRVEIQADRNLIAMAVGNLIDNALNYGPSEGPVSVSLEPFEEYWRIEVHDEGGPIPEAEALRIFEPYVRGVTASGKPGDGLGLFVVRKVAEAHQGKAGVEAAPEGGNRFWFTIGRL